jgi:hypothetical protein
MLTLAVAGVPTFAAGILCSKGQARRTRLYRSFDTPHLARASDPPDAPLLLAAAVGGLGPIYTAPSTNQQFVINTTLDNADSAEASCKKTGGHLAAYTSDQEQVGTKAGRCNAVCGHGSTHTCSPTAV